MEPANAALARVSAVTERATAALALEPKRARMVLTPRAGVLAIVAVLLAVVAASHGLWWAEPVIASPRITWWMFAIAFAFAERIVVHLQIQHEAQTMSLSELPLVIGLFFASPWQLLVGRVVGSALVFIVHRRAKPLKTIFNLALVAAETMAAVTVFTLIIGNRDRVGVAAWIGAYAAAIVASVLGALAVGVVVSLYDTGQRVRDLLKSAVIGQPTTPTVVTLGLLAATSLSLEPSSWWLSMACAGFLLLGYRAYAALSNRHLDLERLYSFSQVVSQSPEVDEVLLRLLRETRELLHAERAEITFVSAVDGGRAAHAAISADDRLRRTEFVDDPHEQWLRQTVVEGQSVVVAGPEVTDPAVRAWLDSRGFRDAVAVPLPGAAGPIGVLTVGDRMGDVRRFDEGDVHLLQTVANHASLALQNGELAEKLRHEALHDDLTDLPNRVQLQRHLVSLLERTGGGEAEGSTVMLLDLDRFKDVNDTLGHDIGDRLLVEVAHRLAAAVGTTAFVARLGGDEFAVIFEGSNRERARRMAKTMLDALAEPVSLATLEVAVAASIGIAFGSHGDADPAVLMKRADTAMYRAKSTGRGFWFYEGALDADSPRRLLLSSELRRAIQSGQVVPHFQPKAEVATGRIVGVEALARWTHPELGAIAPDEFIPIAERTGVIDELTTSIMDASLAACAAWYGAGLELSVAVNVSARSLLDSEIVRIVSKLLAKHGLPPHLLTLEITESGVMTDPERAVEVLNGLRRVGVRLSVDDFGTGYSSLSYLKRLPIHEVKIDRSFVKDLTRGGLDAAIVQSIVGLSANLGLEVVAEGCEDDETLRALAAMGCDLVQGWHLAAAMPAIEVSLWVERRRTARFVP